MKIDKCEKCHKNKATKKQLAPIKRLLCDDCCKEEIDKSIEKLSTSKEEMVELGEMFWATNLY